MKKIIMICLITITLLLTGCGNREYNITCTKDFTTKISKEEIKYNAKIEIKDTNDKIEKSMLTMKFNEEDSAEELCDILKNDYSDNVSCEKKEIKVNNYYELKSIKNMNTSKKEVVNALKKEGFKCK